MNGFVTSMGEKRQEPQVSWWGNLADRSHLEGLDAEGDNIENDLNDMGLEIIG